MEVIDVATKIKKEESPTDTSITLEDIPKRYREFAETVGVEHFLALCRACGGEQIYVPQYEQVCLKIRNDAIRKEYLAGATIAHLAAKHSLTQRHIRDIVSEYPPSSNKT